MSGFDLSRAEAESIVMAARIAAGWVTEEELAAQAAEDELEEDGIEDEPDLAQAAPTGAILNG